MRVFLDANVLFSAANAGSNIATLVQRVVEQHEGVSCELALVEAGRNISLKRPTWHENFLKLSLKVESVPTILFELPVELNEKDRPILCSAILSRCELLVTGDRTHFGHLYDQTIQGVTIVSVLGLASRIT